VSAPVADAGRSVSSFARASRSSPALAVEYAIVPVFCEVVADTLTPVAAYLNIVGEANGFLLESVEAANAGALLLCRRAPLATIVAHGRLLTGTGSLPISPHGTDGVLAALEELPAPTVPRSSPSSRPSHAGVVGYLGYDVVREVEPPPERCRTTTSASRTRHWWSSAAGSLRPLRQRIVLIDNVVADPGLERGGGEGAYAAAGARLRTLTEDCFAPRQRWRVPLPAVAPNRQRRRAR